MSEQVNSKEWWENNFANNWEAHEGSKQTKELMKVLVGLLPDEIRKELDSGLSIIDWGCALGQGTKVLQDNFTDCEVTGLDFSENAIKRAKELHPDTSFRTESLSEEDSYDVFITSNCLEHFTNPIEMMTEQLKNNTNKYYIAMVPHQAGIYGCHFFHFTDDSFPDEIEDFTKICTIVARTVAPAWNGRQQLVIYKRKKDGNETKR